MTYYFDFCVFTVGIMRPGNGRIATKRGNILTTDGLGCRISMKLNPMDVFWPSTAL